MAVYRVERTKDYTVMSNYHLKDTALSLKAKGLLSMFLSFPDDWNYTTRGLASICKEGVEAIGNTIKELEKAGYIVRRQLRGANGRITDTEYVIYEKPQPPEPEDADPDTPPDTGIPDTTSPYPGRPTTAGSSAATNATAGSLMPSFFFQSGSTSPRPAGGGERMMCWPIRYDSPSSPVRSPRRRPTAWAGNWRCGSPRANTLSSSALI